MSEDERDRNARLRLIGLSFQLGFTIVGALILFLGGGIWLDRRFDKSPLFLLIGLVLAFVAIGYTLYEIATIKTRPVKVKHPPAPDAWDDDDNWDNDQEDEEDWPVRRRTVPGTKEQE